MPKASPIQTSFSGGEFSPLVQGRVDSQRYKTGLEVCLNYLPTLQGPVVRRPGTKYIANVKDPSQPPVLVPFTFSQTQQYILEFGAFYLRIFANEGQIITTGSSYVVSGVLNDAISSAFYGIRDSASLGNSAEIVISSSLIASGSILEFNTPITYSELPKLKFAQNSDVLYIVSPDRPPLKLQRFAQTQWTLQEIYFKDGPYLPFNSYKTTGDSLRVTLTPTTNGATAGLLIAGPTVNVTDVTGSPQSLIRLSVASHNFRSGDLVNVTNVSGGPVTVNNAWQIVVQNSTTIDLVGSVWNSTAYVGGGVIRPQLFLGTPIAPRALALISGGARYWGYLTGPSLTSSLATFQLDPSNVLPNTSAISAWSLGPWYGTSYPKAVTFHQDRLVLGGAPRYPQRIDGSVVSDYENFAAAGTSLVVTDSNAYSFNLASEQQNPIYWLKSHSEGLLAGTLEAEWQISPNSQNGAITPTNVSARRTSFFGSANIDAVQSENATLYIQRAQRKLRELNYFFQVNTFRSTDLTELSDQITIPTVTKLAVQKEPFPLVWAKRSDGVLLSMSYNRDDTSLKAGWARHILGGQSDPGGTIPLVKDIAVIAASSATFDQPWVTVQRFINGTSVVTIEALTVPYNDSMPQEDAYCLDCGATYDSPVMITDITNVGPCVVTAASHGFNNGSSVIISDVMGLQKSVTDVNGVISQSSLVNGNTFLVASSTTNSFYLKDFSGNVISGSSYSQYFSGGRVRKLVNSIAGLTWLKGETVGIVADGGIHSDVIVASSGLLALSYPAAKVQIGYRYNSDGSTLRSESGAADGTSIGKLRRINRVAFLLHAVGDFSFGPDFTRLLPCEFPRADEQLADNRTPLFSGLTRDGIEAGYDFDDQLVWRQNSGLPGMVQSVTVMLDETDV